MRSRTQKWMFWILAAGAAFQIYVVREWLAALLLFGVVFAVLAVFVAAALVIDAATRGVSATFAASPLPGQSLMAKAQIIHWKTTFEKAFLADSNPQ
ncbi:MAG: hypothetical protein GZ088_09115 [Acidipila sp.]|nr:hypothetical protein [Acidipila sp.]